MAAKDHPRYAEWKATLERLIAAQDRIHEAPDSERGTAQAEQASALAAYQKISEELEM
jgi:phage-related tail protein